jgi:hypothetical protein
MKKLPAHHRWCNACGGDGRACQDRRRKCEVCVGKGYWNAEDIAAYHKRAPEVCKASCGEKHIDPDFRTHQQQMADLAKLEQDLMDLKARVDAQCGGKGK